nr:hypothetical protein [FCB group bacterium]
MLKSTGFRWLIIGVVLLFSAYKIWPSITYYTMSEGEITRLETEEPDKLKDLYHQVINLGLDLQGGMHVVLEVDIPILAQNLAEKKTEDLMVVIEQASNTAIFNNTDFFTEFKVLVAQKDLRLIKHYANVDGISGKSNDDVITALQEQAENAINSALEIIRNRVDEFGVSEPTIQKSGKSRIIVELAGIKDTERARNLIQRTALLEFVLQKQGADLQPVLEKIDAALLTSDLVSNLNKTVEKITDVPAEEEVDAVV